MQNLKKCQSQCQIERNQKRKALAGFSFKKNRQPELVIMRHRPELTVRIYSEIIVSAYSDFGKIIGFLIIVSYARENIKTICNVFIK